ncbi:17-beta-hydroxysteroid dehydrogenase type 6-like [Tropilaelaps mercedesae]|uniref:17-beta-hydroxysteroid dehydrogenase type 6-like n=1 Tax=Tropilaelaps mercedesae TaxID=418985 RepID=A0A1V9XJL8_9ACAR|nr:17-beta-hydroxysteroid dehydrogenase type 6-like [Tropilaelaps mercedesae]
MASIQRTFDVNVRGSIWTVRTFLPALRASKGRIVLSASVLSNVSSPGFVAYSMSKAAVASLGEGLKRELQVWDVDVSTVQPALYNTGLLRLNQVKSDFFNVQMAELPEQIRRDYGHEYFAAYWNMIAKFFHENANPYPEQAVDMLYHAVTTVWPETHYRVGSWKQMAIYNLLDFMPTEVADLMFNKFMQLSVAPNAALRS